MNLLSMLLNVQSYRTSPVAINLRHNVTADDLYTACRHLRRANDSSIQEFFLDELLIALNEHDQLRSIDWDGRFQDAGQNYALKIIPTNIHQIDLTGNHLIVQAVTTEAFTLPAELLYRDGNADNFPVDETGITAGMPVTLYVDATGYAALLNYGFSETVTRLTADDTLFPAGEEDIIPRRCVQAKPLTVAELPIRRPAAS